jgi:26S proteasome regulatory subunit N2
LYALGLINAALAGCGNTVMTYLHDTLKAAQGEVVQHGAALGLKIVWMGSKSMVTVDELQEVLFNDSAVAGEASGYAMGLVTGMLGTAASGSVRNMLEKRSMKRLFVGWPWVRPSSFLCSGRQEETIQVLLAEKVGYVSSIS